MGTCHEQRADRTRFIIDEDYKIKREMLKSIENFNFRKIKEEEKKTSDNNKSDLVPKTEEPATKPFQNPDNKLISKNKRDFLEIYEPKGPLGEGGYGQVYLVLHRKMKSLRALKKIPIDPNHSGEKIDEEIELLKQLDHPNIVKLFEYFIDNDKYLLVTEYCRGGDLFGLIKKKKKFSEFSAAYIMFQIFRALIYCHNSLHLVHRDIKPENIVVFRKSSGNEDLYDVKLIDFGISKNLELVEKNNDKKIKGSLYYMAPEVFTKKYNEKCDIWSCGVVLYLLVVGKYPFNGKNQKEIIRNIKEAKLTFPEEFLEKSSNEVRDLIKNCLQPDPNKRLSAKDALNHPFFNLHEVNEYFIHVTSAFLNKTINNIKKYDNKNKLQNLCFSYFVHNYPDQEEIILINKVFSKFNTTNDGKMTKEQLKEGLKKYLFKDKKNKNAIEKETEDIFKKLDDNGNGQIECEEFLRAGIDKKLLKNKKVLKFTFDFLDKNRNGEISIEELKEVFKSDEGEFSAENEKEMIELMKSIDTDLNGQISFDEFYNMMLKVIDGLV